jgi:signal transduction histidine kinase
MNRQDAYLSPIERVLLWLFTFMNRPWKVTITATLISGIATGILTFIFFQPTEIADLVTPLLISTLVSAPASHIIGTMFLTYHHLLERRNQELVAANAELNAFAHMVAHDLKSPLSTLSGYTETLLALLPDMNEDEIVTSLRMMQRASHNMHQIITGLLLLAETRNEQIPMAPLDMAQIVRQCQDQLHTTIEQAQAEIHLPEQWPTACGYAPWVEAIWVNYLSNGMKYGGHPPRLELGGVRHGNGEVEFWVKDNGPGISSEDQIRLFNEFTRLEQGVSRARGSGLGLSIVYRLVTRLGGHVGVESQPGQGSRFYFTLPAT